MNTSQTPEEENEEVPAASKRVEIDDTPQWVIDVHNGVYDPVDPDQDINT